MECRYKWRELESNGLLVEVKPVGPSYDSDDINGYSGFRTEALAVEGYKEFKDKHSYDVPSELVLVKFFIV